MLHGIRKTCSRICPSAKCSMMPFPLPAGPSGLEDVTKWMSSLCKFTGLCLGLWAMGYLQLCKHRGCRLTHNLTPTFFLLIYSQWCCACLASFLKLKRAKWSENVSIYSWYSARTSWLKGKQHINHEGRSGHSSHYLGHTVHTSGRETSAIPSHLIGIAHLWPLQIEFGDIWKEQKSEPEWEQESGFCLFVLLNQFLRKKVWKTVIQQQQRVGGCVLSMTLITVTAEGSYSSSIVKG